LGQLIHINSIKGNFKILQLTIPENIPLASLRHVIAHELGHAMQGRNWRTGDGMKLEESADKFAAKWGFPRTKWMKKHQ